jgi:hypothetical protein
MAALVFLPPKLERTPHTTTRLEIHSFADMAIIRLALTERIDRTGDHVLRAWGWRTPAPTFLRYAEQYCALRDFWDLELPVLGFNERPLILDWHEVPEWCKVPNRPYGGPFTL